MVAISPLLDVVGALGFLGAFLQALRLYRRQRLLRNYWLVAATGTALLGVWATLEAIEQWGFAPGVLESRLQILVLTTGLTAVLLVAFYDNTESEALLRRLETSERRTSAIVERFPSGAVVLVDADGECLLAGGDDLFGVTDCAGLTGRSLAESLDEAVVSEVQRLCERALSGDETATELSHDGETYRVQTVPVDEAGEERTCLLVVRNVTVERERERALRDQRDELETLDRVNRVIRDVDGALVGAQTREEIERAVCDRLAEGGPYEFALVTAIEDDDRFVPRAWAGSGGASVDEVFPVESDRADDSPGVRALRTGEIQVVSDVERESAAGPWRESALRQEFRALAVVPVRYGDHTYGVLAVYADRPDAFDERERAALAQFGETVGHAITAVERKERADVLTAMHGATRELLHAETTDEVCDVVLDAGRNLLAVDIGVFAYDEARATLEPAASTAETLTVSANRSDGGPGASLLWGAFVDGEPQVVTDLTEADGHESEGSHDGGHQSDGSRDGGAGSAMLVPLGDHGLFVAESAERGAFDDQTRRLVELLAATTEAAFDRLESDADLREREAQFREQNRRLERLQHINDIIREIDQVLVGATTREEVEQTVCERLAAADRCLFAWIATADGGEAPTPRAWAGRHASYLDEVTAESDGEPTVETLRSGEPTRVTSLSERVREAPWASAAVGRGFRSVVSVPLSYRSVEYGALTVYSGADGMFDDETTAVLSELAETVAYAIDAVETKRGLHAAGGTELELAIPGRHSFLNEVARSSDGPVTCIEAVPESGGRSTVHFRAPGVSPTELASVVDDSVVVERLDAGDGETPVYRATVSEGTITESIVRFGGVPRTVEMTPEETRLVVSLFPHVDARTFVDRLRERYGAVELLARRERAVTRSDSDFRRLFERDLTERQLEVLRTAFEAGYFETPRESTGQDVADRLGISQPTVNHHLRESQRRLLALLFGDAETVDAEQE